MSEKKQIFILAIVPSLVWIILGFLGYFKYKINWSIESAVVSLGAVMIAPVVTFGYKYLKFLTHKDKTNLALYSFSNFLFFYIYKEFREVPECNLVKLFYGAAEAFVMMSGLFFSSIWLAVFNQNSKNTRNKNQNWM